MEKADNRIMGTEKIPSLMIRMAIPSVIAQVINILYNIVDRIYIGHISGVGAAALTGVGLTFPIITLISAFSAFVGSGGAPLASIWMGKNDKKHAAKILGTGVFMLLCFSLILMAVFLIFQRPLLYAFGASDATIGYAMEYADHLSDRNCICRDRSGTESFYHCSGKIYDSYDVYCHRGCDQYCAGSDLYLCIPYGVVKGAAICHSHFPGL